MTEGLRALAVAALLGGAAGCADEPPDPGEPAEHLPLPDLSGVDLEASVLDATGRLAATTHRALWAAHVGTFAGAEVGCPRLWAGGAPDLEMEDGFGWQDDCTNGDWTFLGATGWESTVEADGSGSRTLEGAATVRRQGEGVLQLLGRGEDQQESADEGATWVYSSLVEGEVAGSGVADPVLGATPGGWRGVADVSWTGGARWAFAADAHVTWPEAPLAGGFDAVDVAVAIAGPGTQAACADEPVGRVSLRLASGEWVDVEFASVDPDDEDAALDCDGCGEATVRGLPVGTVCTDFSPLWSEARLPRTPLADFVFTVRDQDLEDRL